MKLVKRLVTWLLTISMILGTLLTDTVAAYAADSYDLTPYIQTEELYKGKYDANDTSNKLSNGFSLDYDTTVTFRITWTLSNALKNITEEDTFSYAIPDNLKYSKSWGYLIQNNEPIGEYTIENNVFKFHYYEKYLNDTKEEANRSGYANLTTTITMEDTNDENGADITWTFPGGATYSGHINEDTSDYGMKISKSAPDAGSNTTSLSARPFTIKVTAEGKNKDVTVTDVLGSYLTVDGGIDKDSYTITKNDGSQVTDYTLNSTSDGFEIVFDEMQDGDVYTISYNVNIDEAALNAANQIGTNNDLNGGLKNTAKVTSNYQTKAKTSSAAVYITKQWLSKSGNYNEDTRQIDWTVTVNVSGVETDLKGAVLKDTLGAGQEYVKDSFHVTPNVDDLTWETLQSGYKFTESTTGTYTITYSTTPDATTSQKKDYTNEVSIKPDGAAKWISTSGTTSVGKEMTVTKTCLTDDIYNNGYGVGGSQTIAWKSVITVPANYGPITGKTFTDTFDSKMTLDADSVALNGESLKDEDGFAVITDGFTYTFDIDNSSEDQTFTFTYSTSIADDQVENNHQYWNKASYNGKEATSNYTYKETERPSTAPVATKGVGESGTKNNNEYGNSLKNSTGTAWWVIGISNGDILKDSTETLTLTDTLPQGLTYVDGSAVVRYLEDGSDYNMVTEAITPIVGDDGTLTFDVTAYADKFANVSSSDWRAASIRYQTTFVLSKSSDSNVMTNKATWTLGNDEGKSATATYTFEAKSLLSKDKEYTSGTAPFVNYTIKVNAKAATINDGQDYSIDDTSGSAISIDWSTIKVTAGDGSSWDGKVVDEKTITGLHDATSYTITYQAKVTKKYTAGATFSGDEAKNTVSFSGKSSDSWSKNESLGKDVQESTAGADETVNNLEIYKHDSENTAKGLDGAVFTLYKVDSARDEATGKVTLGAVDESSGVSRTTATARQGSITKVGRATFLSLTSNQVYLLKETKAPEGYQIDPTYKDGIYLVYTGTDAQTWDYDDTGVDKVINNLETATYSLSVSNTASSEPEEQTHDVVISKEDINGKEIEGASLQVTDADGNVVDEWESVADKTHKVTVKAGTYTLHEEGAPEGYIVASDIEFVVDEDGNVTVAGKDVSKVTMIDEKEQEPEPEEPTYEVVISKEDINGKEIEGASLQVTDADGTIVDEWVSVADETHKVTVKAGTYTLHEEGAPEGYIVASDIEFVVDEDGNVTVAGKDVSKVTMIDELQDQTVKISKVIVSKQDIAGKEIAGATLRVEDEKGNIVVEPFETTGNKENKNTFNIEPGTYILIEETAPAGYVKAESIKFTVDKFGKVTVDGKEVAELVMTDEWSGQEVEISKADIAGDEVVGATLKVEGTDLNDGKFSESWTTEAGKIHKIKVNPGTYTLTETLVPNGYEQAESITFSVTADGKVTIGDNKKAEAEAKVVMTDRFSDATVEISKTDINGKEIDGATLTVTGETRDGKEIEPIEFTTNGTDTHKFKVQPGTYTLTETTAPEGYERAESIVFTVEAGGRIKVGTSEVEKVVMTDAYAKRDVVISKRDIANSKEVAGAYLTVTDRNDKVIDKWTSEKDGGHKISYAWNPNETYTLTEVTAPEGYDQLRTSITFTVALDGTVSIQTNHRLDGKAAALVTEDGILVVNNQAAKSTDDGSKDKNPADTGTEDTKSDSSGSSGSKHRSSSSPAATTTTAATKKTGSSVALVKTDAATGTAVAGAVYELYTKDGALIGTYTTDEYGIIRVDGLEPGEYYFLEKSAPEGYVVDPWQKVFTLTAADTSSTPQIVSVTEEKAAQDVVSTETGDTAAAVAGATGDSSNMVLYGVVAATAAAMLTLWFALNRKSNVR